MNLIPIQQVGDELYVTFTDDLLEELGWNVGDDLNWEIQTDGSFTLIKHETERIHSSTQGVSYRAHRSLNPLHDC